MSTQESQQENVLPESIQAYFTTNPRTVVKLRKNADPSTSHDSMTVCEFLEDAVRDFRDEVAMCSKTPMNVFNSEECKLWEFPGYSVGDGRWFKMTWKELYNNVQQCARALINCGVKPYDVVNIIGSNSPQWIIANLGAIFAGAIPGGVYSTNTPEACLQISSHCGATFVFVENETQLSKYLRIWDKLPSLRKIVQWGGVIPKLDKKYSVLNWRTFMNSKPEKETGAPELSGATSSFDSVPRCPSKELDSRMKELEPGRACTLIFTSGTTGVPKAVMLSHDNITWTARVMWEWVSEGFDFAEQGPHHVVSYLPLSHIAAQMQDIYCAMFGGCTVWFAASDALRGSIPVTLREVRPTVFFGVPRVWEKFHEKICEVGEQSSTLKKMVASWAKGIGKSGIKENHMGMRWSIASMLVFSRVKKALGLDRCVAFYSGAAPLQHETEDFFAGVGIDIRQLFGMSECSGPHTVSVPYVPSENILLSGNQTCGTTMWGCKTNIRGSTGEVQIYGRNVMMGYMNDIEETIASINVETGFLKTGDIGSFDGCGRLKITGRIKELINTAGGEKISPLLIENGMKSSLPYIQECVAIGDRKKHISLLMTLKTTMDSNQNPTNMLHPSVVKFAQQHGSNADTVDKAQCDKSLQNAIQNDINRANQLHIPSRAMQVKQWMILMEPFTMVGGELGPTAKLRRSYVLTKYSKLIENMYTKLVLLQDPPPRRPAPEEPAKTTKQTHKELSTDETSAYIRLILSSESHIKGIVVFGPEKVGKTKSINYALRHDPKVALSPVAVLSEVTPTSVKESMASAQPRASEGETRDTPLVHILETRYTPQELGVALDGFITIFIPERRLT